MLSAAHAQGAADALACFKVADMGPVMSMGKNLVSGIGRSLIGQPGRVFTEGAQAFRPGGFLSAKNVFWPAVSGPGGSKLNWLNRAGTAMGGLGVARALKDDGSGEGTLSRTLGAAGALAGMSYGYPALGMLGAPIAGAVGLHAGHGIGHLLGSHPKDR